jgi:predicted CXXCH cytochrome family protein
MMFLGITGASATPSQISGNCSAERCHVSQKKGEYIHAPVEEDCMNCHQTDADKHPVVNEKEFQTTADVPDLCYGCHGTNDQMRHTHSPFKEGDCLTCHDPHSSDTPGLVAEIEDGICVQCHSDLVPQGDMIHGPVAANMCQACHHPHQSDLAHLLAREGMDLCLFCHTNKKDVQTMPSVHQPFLEGCLQCHQPHSSPYKYMVVIDVPGLCLNCHPAVEVASDRKSEVHGPFQEGEKCYLCHNAHVSEYAHLLQDKEETLCFTCHHEKIQKGSRTIKDIEKRAKSEYVHAPVEGEGCSACHAAHTPDNFFLLSAAFPKGSYGEGKTESFAHCFDCHDSSLMTSEKTTSETEFRDGDLNLHYIHVNREKARNCTTCHDIHGSDYQHLIAREVPFGKWSMPMKYRISEGGGSCLTGCHKELKYDRNRINQ